MPIGREPPELTGGPCHAGAGGGDTSTRFGPFRWRGMRLLPRPNERRAGRGRLPAGIEIGDAYVRVAHAPTGRHAEVALPAGAVVGGEVLDVDAVALAIGEAWRNARIPTRSAVVGVNNSDVVARQTDLPDLDERDLRTALRFELADMIPFDPDTAEVDLRRVELTANDRNVPQARVLAVAAARTMVQDHVAAVTSAKLRCAGVDYTPFALVRALAPLGGDGRGDGDGGAAPPVAIVEIGDQMLTVAVHAGGVVRFCRSLVTRTAASSISDELEDELTLIEQYRQRRAGEAAAPTTLRDDPLVTAILGTLEYASIQPGAQPVGRVVLAGDGARSSEVAARLRTALGVPVALADPLSSTPLLDTTAFPHDTTSRFSGAYGLSCAGDDGAAGPTRLQLLPHRDHATTPRAMALRAAAITGLVLAGLAAATFTIGPDVHGAEAELARTEQHERAVAADLAELGELADQAELTRQLEHTLDRLGEEQVDWSRLVADVRRAAPPGTSLLSLKGSAPQRAKRRTTPGRIELVGRAAGQSSISAWVEAIEQIPGVAEPWIDSVSSRDGGDATFTITAEIDEDAMRSADLAGGVR